MLARITTAALSLVVLLATLPELCADGPNMPTLGGKQFWADELFFHQWRIQRHVLTGHCRLLDEQNRRHASGSFRQCQRKLQSIRRNKKLPPMQGKAVIVLHGLFRTRDSMAKITRYLKEQGGYSVFAVTYPSTQRDVGGHARALARIVENLDDIEEINFVAHSMGNIIIRHYLGDQTADKDPSGSPPSTVVRRPDKRIHRIVMLGPPNHGSVAANTLAKNGLFKTLTGEAGQQLGVDWAKLEGKLATPECQFGIIAGGKGDQEGYNPLLPGDDDGTVTVASARLDGAKDFIVVPVLHSFLMNDPKVQQYTLRFLQEGQFLEP